MAYFPMFVELKDQNVWVIGGGNVAYRKVKKLLPYGAKITVGEKMAYFPMFVELKDQNVWVIGGGNVAYRKVKKLLPYGAKITVIAPHLSDELEKMSEIIKITQNFRLSMLESLENVPDMVIAATDDVELNDNISSLCREKRIPVNVADDLEKCSFVFPALVKQGKLSAGI